MSAQEPQPKVRHHPRADCLHPGANVPFGELTAKDARARADELRAAIGWGPTARVAPVAMAWRELSLDDEARGGTNGE